MGLGALVGGGNECAGREFRPTGSEVYAAPSLVHHYVVAHGYRPPEEFIAAVLARDESADGGIVRDGG